MVPVRELHELPSTRMRKELPMNRTTGTALTGTIVASVVAVAAWNSLRFPTTQDTTPEEPNNLPVRPEPTPLHGSSFTKRISPGTISRSPMLSKDIQNELLANGIDLYLWTPSGELAVSSDPDLLHKPIRASGIAPILPRMLALKLAEERRLDRGARLVSYFGETVSDSAMTISVDDVINNTTGRETRKNIPANLETTAEVAEWILRLPKNAIVGRDVRQSIHNPVLLIATIEAALNRAYDVSLHEELFEPAGIKNSSVGGAVGADGSSKVVREASEFTSTVEDLRKLFTTSHKFLSLGTEDGVRPLWFKESILFSGEKLTSISSNTDNQTTSIVFTCNQHAELTSFAFVQVPEQTRLGTVNKILASFALGVGPWDEDLSRQLKERLQNQPIITNDLNLQLAPHKDAAALRVYVGRDDHNTLAPMTFVKTQQLVEGVLLDAFKKYKNGEAEPFAALQVRSSTLPALKAFFDSVDTAEPFTFLQPYADSINQLVVGSSKDGQQRVVRILYTRPILPDPRYPSGYMINLLFDPPDQSKLVTPTCIDNRLITDIVAIPIVSTEGVESILLMREDAPIGMLTRNGDQWVSK